MNFSRLVVLAVAILWACAFAKADNFIVDLKQVKDFELLLEPNQTLIVNYRTGELLGILETLENGKYKKIPIPNEWKEKNVNNAFRLKNYSDYNIKKSQIGASTHTSYERNDEFEQLEDVQEQGSEFELMQESNFSKNTQKTEKIVDSKEQDSSEISDIAGILEIIESAQISESKEVSESVQTAEMAQNAEAKDISESKQAIESSQSVQSVQQDSKIDFKNALDSEKSENMSQNAEVENPQEPKGILDKKSESKHPQTSQFKESKELAESKKSDSEKSAKLMQ